MREIVSFEPAPNGGEVTTAVCYACKAQMQREAPIAVVFHASVSPTLHTRFTCPQCSISLVVEEDARDAGVSGFGNLCL